MAEPFRRPHGVYYIRIAIPSELRSLYQSPGKKPPEEKLVSLKTRNKKHADVAAARAVLEHNAEFEAKRWDLRPRLALTQDDLHEAALATHNRLVAADEDHRLRGSRALAAELDAVWAFLQGEYPDDEDGAWKVFQGVKDALENPAAARRERTAAIKAEMGSYGDTTVREDVAEFVKERHLDAVPGDASWKKIANAIQRGEREANLSADRLDKGELPELLDKLVSAPATPRAKVGEGIMDIFAKYEKQEAANKRPETWDQSRKDVELYVSTLPARSTMAAISKASVRDWLELCQDYPKRASDTKLFKGMSMAEAVAHNEGLGEDAKPVVSVKTVNRWLSAVGSFCKWAINRGYLDLEVNPCHGLYAEAPEFEAESFTPEQLKTLFASEMFVGDVERDYKFWLPLVQAFTGMRQGEVAQLLVRDVFEQHGRWTIFVTKKGGHDKSIKRGSSERVIAVHPTLEEVGFIDYVKAMRAAGHERLFPTAERKHGQWVPDYSREFSRHLERLGLKDGPGLSAHSFRHTAIDAMRAGGFLDAEIAPIVGHAKLKLQTSGYGRVQEDRLLRDAPVVDSIAYEGLDLSHLFAIGLT